MIAEFIESPLYKPDDIWVVTPKIHGANFTIDVNDSGDFIVAKRTDVIQEDESFFNYQRALAKHNYKQLITSLMNNTYESLDGRSPVRVTLHGELCGGFYPDMPSIPGVSQVMKKNSIYYSNDIEIVLFDAKLYSNDTDYVYLNHHTLIEECNLLRITVAPVLFEGTLRECLNWSSLHNADLDETWMQFNMPQGIPDNIREGHVIKSLRTIFKGDHRMAFKDKNAKHSENGKHRTPKERLEIVYDDEVIAMIEDASEYININKFNSVVSKFGEYTIQNFAEIMRLFVDDIIEEFEVDFNELSISNQGIIKKSLIRKVSTWMGNNKVELF